MDSLNFSKTVQSHTGRPYQESKLTTNEIIESTPPSPDPRGTGALSWNVEGSFNGSVGRYELIIDPKSNTVWHFVFYFLRSFSVSEFMKASSYPRV